MRMCERNSAHRAGWLEADFLGTGRQTVDTERADSRPPHGTRQRSSEPHGIDIVS